MILGFVRFRLLWIETQKSLEETRWKNTTTTTATMNDRQPKWMGNWAPFKLAFTEDFMVHQHITTNDVIINFINFKSPESLGDVIEREWSVDSIGFIGRSSGCSSPPSPGSEWGSNVIRMIHGRMDGRKVGRKSTEWCRARRFGQSATLNGMRPNDRHFSRQLSTFVSIWKWTLLYF